jgi:hypothetical protein
VLFPSTIITFQINKALSRRFLCINCVFRLALEFSSKKPSLWTSLYSKGDGDGPKRTNHSFIFSSLSFRQLAKEHSLALQDFIRQVEHERYIENQCWEIDWSFSRGVDIQVGCHVKKLVDRRSFADAASTLFYPLRILNQELWLELEASLPAYQNGS